MLILKIILKIILVILLVLLALIAAILLVRLKYIVNAGYDESLRADADVSLIFGAVRVLYKYGGEDAGTKILLFGRELRKKPKPAQESPPAEAADAAPAEEKPDSYDFYADDAEIIPDTEHEEPEPQAESEPQAEPEPKKRPKKPPREERKSEKPKKEPFFDKMKRKYQSFDNFKSRYDIPLLLHNIKIYIGEQLRSIGIKGGSLGGILGLGDPSYTGLALGGLGVVQATAPLDIDVAGDFEKTNIALEGSIYGKTYLLKLAAPVLRLIFKKPVRTIIADILFKKG